MVHFAPKEDFFGYNMGGFLVFTTQGGGCSPRLGGGLSPQLGDFSIFHHQVHLTR